MTAFLRAISDFVRVTVDGGFCAFAAAAGAIACATLSRLAGLRACLTALGSSRNELASRK
jgi:hypothetical protein